MNRTSEFPEITFKCPKVWAEMRGDERIRFCEVCQRQVHNLSTMSRDERRALLTAEGESPCVAYFKHLDGTAVDVNALLSADPLRQVLSRAAALSLGAASLLPACATSSVPTQGAAEKNPAAMSVPTMVMGDIAGDGGQWRREMLQRIVQGG